MRAPVHAFLRRRGGAVNRHRHPGRAAASQAGSGRPGRGGANFPAGAGRIGYHRGADATVPGQRMSDADIRARLEGLAAAFNAHDIDAIMAFFAEDCSLDMPRGPEPHGRRFVGRDEVRRGLMMRFESTPDVRYDEVEHFVSGDTGMSKWLLTGTTPDGQKVTVRGCDFYSFRDGLVSRKDSYWKIVA
jgi:ketosteroid isomerase-like protein